MNIKVQYPNIIKIILKLLNFFGGFFLNICVFLFDAMKIILNHYCNTVKI